MNNSLLTISKLPLGRPGPALITAIYVLVGALWIPVTDGFLAAQAIDVAHLTSLQTFKGWSFVLITAVLLYVLIRYSLATLERAYAQLNAVIENTTDGIFIKDLKGRNVLINTAGARDLGRSVEDIVGRDNTELLPPDTASLVIAEDRRVVAGGEPRVFEHEATLGGVTRTWSIAKAPYRDARGRIIGVIGIARDITAYKQTEEALRDSEERLRLAMAAARMDTWEWDIRADRVTWDDNKDRLFGVVPGTFGGTREGFLELVHPADRDSVAAAINGAVEQGVPYHTTFRILRPDGSLRWMAVQAQVYRDSTGQAMRMIGVVQDITEYKQTELALQETHAALERRVQERTAELLQSNQRLQQEIAERAQAEAALRESEERFRQLVERLDEIFWMSSADGNQMLYVSPAYEKIRGHSCQRLYEHPTDWLEAVHPEDRERLQGVHERIVAEGRFDEEYRILRFDGAIRWVRSRAFVIRNPAGEIYRIAGIIEDITERRRVEAQTREQQTELAHLARLSLAGEMAAGLAHELNQPLGAITTLAGACRLLLHAEQLDTACLADAIEQIDTQSQRAGEIIRRLRGFTRKVAPRWAKVDLNALVQEVIGWTQRQAREQEVTLQLDLAEPLAKVLADPIQIQQVLLNLLRNALEALQDSRIGERVVYIRTAQVKGATVEVAVSDTGSGLSAQAAERLFHPFFTTKPDGMGLGLGISRSIIEAHRGRLWATPNADRGVTFHFTLPAASEDPPTAC